MYVLVWSSERASEVVGEVLASRNSEVLRLRLYIIYKKESIQVQVHHQQIPCLARPGGNAAPSVEGSILVLRLFPDMNHLRRQREIGVSRVEWSEIGVDEKKRSAIFPPLFLI